MKDDLPAYWNQFALWADGRPPRFWRATSAALVLLGFLLAFTAVNRKSVTVDELQALPSGIAVWQTGDFRYPLGTPPLSQLLPAIPLLFTRALVKPVEGPTANWAVAHQFSDDNPESFHYYFFLGRLVSGLVFALTLCFTYLLARSLYGEKGAALALFCAALNPSLLGHGALITPDIYLACALMGFLVVVDRYLREPSVKGAALLGLGIASACLVKLTGLWLFFLCAFFMLGLREKTLPWKKSLVHFFLACVVAIFLINAGYLFQETLKGAGSFEPASPGLRAMLAFLPRWLPIPFPLQFLRVIDQQLAEVPYIAYLLGETNIQGFFSYYLVGLLVKTPPALLFLVALAWLAKRRPSKFEAPLLTVALFFFLFFSVARYKNIGFRYLLFLYPILAVWIARLTLQLKAKQNALAALACVSLLFSGLAAWPSYISYFNLPSGGTLGGHRYLLDSNLDWGQDLTTLKDFMLERGIDSIDLAHFGHVSPSLYGIKFSTLNGPPTKRFVGISANFLWGRSYFVNGTQFYPEHLNAYIQFRAFEPEAVLGGSLYVYDMEKIRAFAEKAAP